MNPTLKKQQLKKQQLKKARMITLAIAGFGLLVLLMLNWNVDLVFQGNKYEGKITGKVRSTSNRQSYHNILTIQFLKNDALVTIEKSDNSRSFSSVSHGDEVTLYESTSQPFRYYSPGVNATPSLLVLLFFVVVPLFFVVFGRVG